MDGNAEPAWSGRWSGTDNVWVTAGVAGVCGLRIMNHNGVSDCRAFDNDGDGRFDTFTADADENGTAAYAA